MVELIGLTTLVALIWLLAVSMKNECDAERRRLSTLSAADVAGQEKGSGSGTKQAA
jgi:hypothetical protein